MGNYFPCTLHCQNIFIKVSQRENGCESTSVILPFIRSFSNGRGVRSGFQQRGDRGLGGQSDPWGSTCPCGRSTLAGGLFFSRIQSYHFVLGPCETQTQWSKANLRRSHFV